MNKLAFILAALTAAVAPAGAEEAPAASQNAPAPAPTAPAPTATGAASAAPANGDAPAPTPALAAPEAQAAVQKTYQFLKNAGTYYLATVEGDQPRVRPFGTALIFEGRLYIQTGRKKNVAKQLLANGKAEICAFKDGEWIRVTGVLMDDPRLEPQKTMLDAHPTLKKMYAPGDGNNMVLYFRPGSVTSVIYAFGKEPVEMKF